MDWYAWLCRAGLHPDVAFEYALLFARNELGAADVRHLDHEFLLSMGVAVAKHRLEILKLARKDPSSSSSSHGGRATAMAAITVVLPWRATRLLAAAVHRSARSALGRLRASVSHSRGRDRDRAAAVLATPRLLPLLRHRGGRVAHSSWSKIASPVAVRGGGKLPHVGKPVLLTNSYADKWRGNGGAAVRTLPAPAGSIAACLMSTDVCSCDEDEEGDGSGSDVEVVVDVGGEEMRWESMFQDLKPT
ncbi:unnamed protein product [Miscanthus lutarioriparius]|uniref:SAM domain-containing protein n=1 Tax=Miscanthus lutarioriparius TaxID=422564 RepID=A0A811S4U8_9POAL|nr:unnamed protein product [Miscanthus lutarioriparius]